MILKLEYSSENNYFIPSYCLFMGQFQLKTNTKSDLIEKNLPYQLALLGAKGSDIN
jgi:hypothetical protein